MSHPIETEQRPTRFSTVAVPVVTLAVTWVLVDAVGLTLRVLYGTAGALLLAGMLWLLATDRYRVVGAAISGFAFPLVGLALLAGAGYTITAQLRATVPVGSVFLVLGATVAVFGAVTAVHDVLERATLVRCLRSGLRTTFVVGTAMSLTAYLRFGALGQLVSVALGRMATVLFSPTAPLPVASFLVLLAAGIYGIRRAVHALPIAEIAAESLSPALRHNLDTVDRWLSVLRLPFGLVIVAAVLLELGQSTPYGWLPAGSADLLGPVVRFEPARSLLGVLAVTSAVALVAASALRSTYQRSSRESLLVMAPYGSGLAVTMGTIQYDEALLSVLTGRLERELPAQLITAFRTLREDALSTYGGDIVALVVLTGLLVVALVVVGAMLLGVIFGTVSEGSGGASVAGAGLFTTATFAAVLGIWFPLALLGVVASLLIWDVGEFGATMGREVGGRSGTTRTELVHVGGTLLVGVGGAVAALAIERTVRVGAVGSTASVVALVGAVAGVLLLVVASR